MVLRTQDRRPCTLQKNLTRAESYRHLYASFAVSNGPLSGGGRKRTVCKKNFDLTVFKVIIFYSKSLVYNLNFLSYCCISFNGDRF